MGKALIDSLFWLMLVAGGGSLAACVLLPAWLDRTHAESRLEKMKADVDTLEREVEAARLQIAHLRADPEYNERFVRQEFNVQTPGVEVVDLTPWLAEAEAAEGAAEPAPNDSQRWQALLEEESRRSPYLTVFLLPDKRPLAMLMSGGLVVTAVVLMAARGRPAAGT